MDGVKKLFLIQRNARSGDVIVPMPDRRLIFPFGVSLPLVDSLDGPCVKSEDLEQFAAYATIEITSRAA